MKRQLVSGAVMLGVFLWLGNGQAEASHRSNEPATCSCRATIGLSPLELQFRDGVLNFIPRVNVMIRSRGATAAPSWTATVTYAGQVTPAGGSFGGSQTVAQGPCGSRFSLRGVQLQPVPIAGLTRTLLGEEEELTEAIDMTVTVAGCGYDEVHKMSRFTLKQFGNLVVRGWRTVH